MTSRLSRRDALTYGTAVVAATAAGVAAPDAAHATPDTRPAGSARTGAGAVLSPDGSARPRLRYWWPGSGVTPEQIAAEVGAMADAGFGGFEIADVRNSQHIPMPPGIYGWGNDAWHTGVAAALRTANARGLRADITIGPYWPAVVPGLRPDSDAAMKELTYGQAIVAAGARFTGSPPAPHRAPSGASSGPPVTVTPVLQAVHVAQVVGGTTAAPLVLKASTLADITARVTGGSLDWTAPSTGTWVVIASYSRGTAMIEKQSYYEGYFYPFTDPQAYVVDHFGPAGAEAIIQWWETDLLTPELRTLLRANGGDFFEDSLEFNTELHWTPRMREEFHTRRGYDLTTWLPLVHGQTAAVYTVDDPALAGGVRWDYFQTLSDLYIDHHVTPLNRWARTLGMRLRNQAYGAPLDSGLAAARTAVPEGESLGFGSTPDSFRLLAAARDLSRGQVLSSELGAGVNQAYRTSLADLARTANVGYALGVNQARIHGFSYAAAPASQWPGFYPWAPLGAPINFSENWNPRIPQWPFIADLTGYMTRTQTILQSGTEKVDVAVYRQSFDATSTQYDGSALSAAGYSYHIVSWGLLGLPTATVRGRRLDPDGPGYRALILDHLPSLLLDSARQILSLARAGLPVLIVGTPPTAVPNADPGGVQAAALATTLARLLALPNVRVLASNGDVPTALEALKVTPSAAPDGITGLLHTRRDTGNVTYFFLTNTSAAPADGTLTLAGTGTPLRIDAWTGHITPVARYDSATPGHVGVPVTAAPGESVIIALARDPHALGIRVASAHAVTANTTIVYTPTGTLAARATTPGHYRAVLHTGRTVTATADVLPAAPALTTWDLNVTGWRPTNPGATGQAAVATTTTTHHCVLSTLVPWRQLAGLETTSGVGTYTTEFTLSDAWRHTYGATLSLGSAGAGSAHVSLNGSDLGPVNHLNPVLDLGSRLRPGVNRLVVTVATTLINQMRANQPTVFTQPAQDYGLLGPVTITPYLDVPLA